jgi:hypothetical protein
MVAPLIAGGRAGIAADENRGRNLGFLIWIYLYRIESTWVYLQF